jgi:hypothetical protein
MRTIFDVGIGIRSEIAPSLGAREEGIIAVRLSGISRRCADDWQRRGIEIYIEILVTMIE